MVKSVFTAITLLASSQAFCLDWERPDCSKYADFGECRNAESNNYRLQKQQEFREKGLSFWYYERPDYSDNKKVEQALEDKVEGALFFSFTVKRDGSVADVALKSKTSDEVAVFAEPILAAIKNWQFVPSEKDWQDQEWRYQFFFKQEDCDAEASDTEACAAEEKAASAE
ncbi:energy transducer TonB [Microbulbifer pacificus]|uniref:Energy transducer TonB n=1 Tax=Microbulbifer pacificus TaxID=407164 RepID=A0AAU0MXG5_9GAMM|nr:energy transducer TonB [Microbulbifer pacificus]WOX04158.1 energy transducer TonB [Microbulbifer pacificus]